MHHRHATEKNIMVRETFREYKILPAGLPKLLQNCD